MKAILFSIMLLNSAVAATWKAGDEAFDLIQNEEKDWVSSGCLKTCEIDQLASKLLKSGPLSAEELSGGKNPGSVICRKIVGQVIYLEQGQQTDAFCRLGDQIVSLSRLTRLYLN